MDAGGRHGFLLATGGAFLTVLLFPLPFAAPLGFTMAVAGLVVGVRAGRRARAAGGVAPGATAAIVTGALAAGMSAVLGLGVLLFLGEITRYQDCMSGANTRVAEAACEDALRDAIEDRTGIRP